MFLRCQSRREALRVMSGSALIAGICGLRAGQSPRSTACRIWPLRVQNEFGPLRTALVHDACNAVDTTMEQLRRVVDRVELAEHPETGPSFRNQIICQHAAFRRVLAQHGVTLISPQTQPGAFCQVFTRDPCFVIGDTLFVGSLRDEYRRPETAGLACLRTQVRSVVDLGGNGATIEGGDVMILDSGSRILVGTHRHTNETGHRRLAAHLSRSGIEVVRVPHRALHLDCCLAPLPNGEALYSATKLPESSVTLLQRYFERLIPLPRPETEMKLAANLFWINERRVVSMSAAVETNRLLRGKGYDVIELDFSQLVCLWGSFRCVVCPLERS